MHGSEVGRQVARGDLAVSFVKTRCKVSKIVLKEKKKGLEQGVTGKLITECCYCMGVICWA